MTPVARAAIVRNQALRLNYPAPPTPFGRVPTEKTGTEQAHESWRALRGSGRPVGRTAQRERPPWSGSSRTRSPRAARRARGPWNTDEPFLSVDWRCASPAAHHGRGARWSAARWFYLTTEGVRGLDQRVHVAKAHYGITGRIPFVKVASCCGSASEWAERAAGRACSRRWSGTAAAGPPRGGGHPRGQHGRRRERRIGRCGVLGAGQGVDGLALVRPRSARSSPHHPGHGDKKRGRGLNLTATFSSSRVVARPSPPSRPTEARWPRKLATAMANAAWVSSSRNPLIAGPPREKLRPSGTAPSTRNGEALAPAARLPTPAEALAGRLVLHTGGAVRKFKLMVAMCVLFVASHASAIPYGWDAETGRDRAISPVRADPVRLSGLRPCSRHAARRVHHRSSGSRATRCSPIPLPSRSSRGRASASSRSPRVTAGSCGRRELLRRRVERDPARRVPGRSLRRRRLERPELVGTLLLDGLRHHGPRARHAHALPLRSGGVVHGNRPRRDRPGRPVARPRPIRFRASRDDGP